MRESFADPAANPHTAWGAGFSRLLRRPALPGPFRYGTPSSTDRRNTIVSPAERFEIRVHPSISPRKMMQRWAFSDRSLAGT